MCLLTLDYDYKITSDYVLDSIAGIYNFLHDKTQKCLGQNWSEACDSGCISFGCAHNLYAAELPLHEDKAEASLHSEIDGEKARVKDAEDETKRT